MNFVVAQMFIFRRFHSYDEIKNSKNNITFSNLIQIYLFHKTKVLNFIDMGSKEIYGHKLIMAGLDSSRYHNIQMIFLRHH